MATGFEPVIIYGGRGFIGSHLTRALVSTGVEVIQAEPRAPLPIFIHSRPVKIIYLSWNTLHRQSQFHQNESLGNFELALNNLTDIHVKSFFLFGSASEFGNQEGYIDESSNVGPSISPYGQSKRDAVKKLENWSAHHSIPATVLRPFIVYGQGQRGSMLLPQIADRISRSQKLDVTRGDQVRDFLHISDLVTFTLRALMTPAQYLFNAYNLGSGQPVHLNTLFELVCRITGKTDIFNIGSKTMNPEEPLFQAPVIAKAQRDLGFVPKIGLEKGLTWLFSKENTPNVYL